MFTRWFGRILANVWRFPKVLWDVLLRAALGEKHRPLTEMVTEQFADRFRALGIERVTFHYASGIARLELSDTYADVGIRTEFKNSYLLKKIVYRDDKLNTYVGPFYRRRPVSDSFRLIQDVVAKAPHRIRRQRVFNASYLEQRVEQQRTNEIENARHRSRIAESSWSEIERR